MALSINGVIGIVNVQKKKEQKGNFQNIVYYGTLITKEDFTGNNMQFEFKMECRTEKQAAFYDKYLMIPGKGGYAKGTLGMVNGQMGLVLEKVEFGSFKMEGMTPQQNNNYGAPAQQASYNNNNNTQYNASAPSAPAQQSYTSTSTPSETPAQQNNIWSQFRK